MTDAEKDKKNKEELKAWMQWKEVCAIMKCDEPLREILKAKVTDAFRKKFARISPEVLKIAFNENNVNWANEFDIGIIEKSELSKTKKNYKDFTWQKIKESSDPPLKVIRGELLGGKSIINGIAERYLRVNHHTVWKNVSGCYSNYKRCKRHGKSKNCKKCDKYENCKNWIFVSTEAPLNEGNTGDSRTIGSTLQDNSKSPESSFDIEVLEQCFPKFSNTDAAILLCHLEGIALTNPNLLEFVGKAKTRVNDRLNNFIVPKLRNMSNDCKEACKKNTDFIISSLKEQISSEKGSQKVLLDIEQMKNDKAKNDERSKKKA